MLNSKSVFPNVGASPLVGNFNFERGVLLKMALKGVFFCHLYYSNKILKKKCFNFCKMRGWCKGLKI